MFACRSPLSCAQIVSETEESPLLQHITVTFGRDRSAYTNKQPSIMNSRPEGFEMSYSPQLYPSILVHEVALFAFAFNLR